MTMPHGEGKRGATRKLLSTFGKGRAWREASRVCSRSLASGGEGLKCVAYRRQTSGWFHVNEPTHASKREPDGRGPQREALGPTEQSFRLIVETIPGLVAVMTP